MKVKSDDRTIIEVLRSYYLRIPRFQRPYEWEDVEIDEFWEDVTTAESDYFIGSMVLFQSTYGTQGVVDGQQRITTITALLCVLRDKFRSVGKDDQADGLQNLIERASELDNQKHFVLQHDRPSKYLRYVQAGQSGDEPATDESERRLKKAVDRLRNKVDTLCAGIVDTQEVVGLLLKLRDSILELRLITVEVDNEEDATVIFQTLNSRGRDLETADLVKSHLFSILRATNPQNDVPREKWSGIQESFSISKADLPMDRFLLHSWLSRYEYLASADLGKTVRRTVSRELAESYLDQLVADSRFYREIHEPTFREAWQQEERPILDAFNALQIFRVRQPLPWLLSAWRAYGDKQINLKYVRIAILAIERFHFIATAISSQPSSGGVSKMYAAHARQLSTANSNDARYKIVRDLHAKLSDDSRLPSLDQFSADFAELRYSRRYTQQQRLVLHILQRLYSYHSNIEPDFKLLTVEHIIPQASLTTPPSSVASIGNLILIPRELNEKLADKNFDEKRLILDDARKSGVYIDDSIISASSWGEAEIAKRSRDMAEEAFGAVWSLSTIPGL
ncbi:DUF262 domain-containing HNH endonuclease family protein [Gordonia sp. ABSL1-1]|uniref:DUF262 domain-containing protein n=1 Tax=Gordonia sp. ABSL1-1 TaxID=3053923 RepID=UPI002573DF92|nr:DUF262 domain-containing HNH endonuclease family protein [Gordonia sp. ABSL1-1]MDL9938986.1 DUF262 domain-containing HNH endonuclease family protein [Gordonia sp. ABSL1-1]